MKPTGKVSRAVSRVSAASETVDFIIAGFGEMLKYGLRARS